MLYDIWEIIYFVVDMLISDADLHFLSFYSFYLKAFQIKTLKHQNHHHHHQVFQGQQKTLICQFNVHSAF